MSALPKRVTGVYGAYTSFSLDLVQVSNGDTVMVGQPGGTLFFSPISHPCFEPNKLYYGGGT